MSNLWGMDRLRQFLLLIARASAPAWLTTKGVLADWLDDQGDGERAQKVRVVDFSLDAFAKAMFDDFQRFAHTSAPTWEYARNAASFVCDRDMRRRVLGLFPGVWLTVDALVAFDAKTAFPAIQTGFVNALLAAGFVYNNAARDAFSWSALPADGGIPAPKEDVSWNMWQGARDGDKTRFVQRIHAPDLVPPEPQRNRPIIKNFSLKTGIANASPGGADEELYALFTITNSGNVVIDLANFTDIAGQTGAAFFRVKSWE